MMTGTKWRHTGHHRALYDKTSQHILTDSQIPCLCVQEGCVTADTSTHVDEGKQALIGEHVNEFADLPELWKIT